MDRARLGTLFNTCEMTLSLTMGLVRLFAIVRS